MNLLSTDLSSLIQCNLNTLADARNMLGQLPAEKYNHVERPYFESCLGKHIRHVLDHYLCFVRDVNTGIIDYEQRQRDRYLETNKEGALTAIRSIQNFFTQQFDKNDRPLQVLLCSDISHLRGEATPSSVSRELQFLQGHAVHHYALIAAMLRFYGIAMTGRFGVAPSTQIYEKTERISA